MIAATSTAAKISMSVAVILTSSSAMPTSSSTISVLRTISALVRLFIAVTPPARPLVPLAGLEPALLSELDFESSASTNSTTGARAAGGALYGPRRWRAMPLRER